MGPSRRKGLGRPLDLTPEPPLLEVTMPVPVTGTKSTIPSSTCTGTVFLKSNGTETHTNFTKVTGTSTGPSTGPKSAGVGYLFLFLRSILRVGL